MDMEGHRKWADAGKKLHAVARKLEACESTGKLEKAMDLGRYREGRKLEESYAYGQIV